MRGGALAPLLAHGQVAPARAVEPDEDDGVERLSFVSAWVASSALELGKQRLKDLPLCIAEPFKPSSHVPPSRVPSTFLPHPPPYWDRLDIEGSDVR